ncbi:hypothetical protein C3747_50g106 [Trypanosoma cruzi]|uniref:Uncharacterized protein n=3 Tax=Trypanosoma cruzi TaxID=5693 RepID=Q4E2N0_TRYCC|nr:hypothetical protein, conserved [Trypanosoma cruzi]EAN99032.1 hypothetical protein, conserved [Trypanosoma cruzi]PWV12560.1 hypothetical protein C3747_50g106 [Trypanosoma cruzi]RNC48632.1 hypothetical protein TcCL_NonESM01483 [Trypanosoma cruzi]|eukprot:XP_820883.1 hypothetical protein [Trypanosoma cruzi strain CL Brener]
MLKVFDGKGTTNTVVTKSEDWSLSAPYRSPFGGYNHYPTMLFKRHASPVPSNTEESYLKNSTSQGTNVGQDNGDVRSSSRARPRVKGYRDNVPMVTPLMDRYKRSEPIHNKKAVERDVNEGQNHSGSKTLTSSNSLKASSKIYIMPSTGNVNAQGKRSVSSSEAPNEVIDSRRCRGQQCRRMTTSCPPVLVRDGASNGQKSMHIKGNGDASTPSTCYDTHCIHGRQAILDYVDLQRNLRVCHATVRDQDRELNELRSQLHLLHTEKVELESRFQIELQGLESRYAESLGKEREEQMEWQKRILSEQLANYEREREELEQLRMELEQERLNHDRTRSELDAAQGMCMALKQQLENLKKASNASFSPSGKKDSPAGKYREDFLLDTQSPTSVFMTPTPRRQPPPVPQLKEGEEYTSGINVSKFSLGREKSKSLRPFRDDSPTDKGFVENVTANSTINVSDPSVAFSMIPEFDPDDGHVFWMNKEKQDNSAKRVMEGNKEEFDGETQRETEEWTEGDGGPSSCETRNTNLPTVVAQKTESLANDASSYGRSLTKALSDAAFTVQLHPAYQFEEIAGQESLLCKELLRILLDKEKQIAELTSERMGLLGETKFTSLSDPIPYLTQMEEVEQIAPSNLAV